jgi:hypothetical protein
VGSFFGPGQLRDRACGETLPVRTLDIERRHLIALPSEDRIQLRVRGFVVGRFGRRSLPDAVARLVHGAGRLAGRESDPGGILYEDRASTSSRFVNQHVSPPKSPSSSVWEALKIRLMRRLDDLIDLRLP